MSEAPLLQRAAAPAAGKVTLWIAGAVLVVFVPAKKRKSDDKDWSAGPVIRIQAYADPGHHSSKIYPGAEYPLGEPGVLPLIDALCKLTMETAIDGSRGGG